MATIVTRSGKGSALTHQEMDDNFSNLNTDKLETSGGSVTGDISFGDNDKAQFGAGNDLQIYHDSSASHSYITESGTGSLIIKGQNLRLRDASDNNYVFAESGGAVTLYNNNSAKLATTSTGIDVTGNVTTSGNIGVGTSSPDTPLGGATGIVLDSGSSVDCQLRLQNDTTGNTTTDGGLFSISGSDMYLWNYENSTMRFGTNSTERMRIDSSGNVGIGVTPTTQYSDHTILQVGGQTAFGSNSTLSTTSQTYLTHNLYADTSGTWQVFNTSSANEGSLLRMANGMLRFSNSSATTGTPTVTERFRIDSSGNVGINTSSPSVKLQIATPNATAGFVVDGGATNGYYNMELRNNSANGYGFAFKHGGTIVGSIRTTSSSTSYNTSSDYRLKENVVDMEGAIDRVKTLQPRRFNWIADADTTVDGFIAHEVSDIVPEAISGEKDATKEEEYEVIPAVLDDDGEVVTEAVMGTRTVPDYQGIDQSKLVPLLTGALQEAIAKIEALETRIETLEGA